MASTLPQTLCLLALAAGAYANPVPVPPPFTATTDASGPSCTTVLTSTISGFHGDFTPKVAETVYTKTVTEHSLVPCGGCALSVTTVRAPDWGGIGPVEIITGTTTAAHASTTTVPVCNGYPARRPPTHGQIPRRRAEIAVSSPPRGVRGCTSTKVVPFPSPLPLSGAVKTVFTATATSTRHVDCGGCRFLAVSTGPDYLHPGPVVRFTSTVTAAAPVEETAYVCLKSPSVVLPPASPTPTPMSGTGGGAGPGGDVEVEDGEAVRSTKPPALPPMPTHIKDTSTTIIFPGRE